MTAKHGSIDMLVLRFEFQKFRILNFFELSPMWYPYLMTVLGYMHFEE